MICPVPKDSSPQMNGVYVGLPGKYDVPLSIKLPKNFHPVGTSKQGMSFLAATMSRAPDVGIDRAQPFKPFLNCGIRSAFATRIANESEGEMKNCELMIMFLSASPSAAAPKLGGGFSVSILRPSLFKPIVLTSSTA